MKKLTFLFIVISLMSVGVNAQTVILDESFENNSCTGNAYELTNNWPDTIQNSWEIDGGTMDLITTNSCADPSAGDWFVSCNQTAGGWPYMAFSIGLLSPTVPGIQYSLLFDKIFCGPNSSPIDVGFSNDSTLIGTALHTFSAPTTGNWVTDTFLFTATASTKFLTVNVGVTGSTGTIGLDDFILTALTTSVNEINSSFNSVYVFPNPVESQVTVNSNQTSEKIISISDVLGREVFHQFSNHKSEVINLQSLSQGIYFLQCGDSFPVKVMKL